MKVVYFCALTVAHHLCGLTGRGMACPPVVGCLWRRSMLFGMLFCQFLMSSAQEVSGDSVPIGAYRFRPKQLVTPSVLIAVGSFGVSNGWFCGVKRGVRDNFQDLRGDHRFRADNYLQYLPVLANVGLGMVGVKSHHPLRERVAATATAYALMGLMVNVTKYAVREKRPDTHACNSFPSGHTATAFMGAELVREEYGNACGTGAYVFATGIAFLRLYNDRHWLNDVLAGAGVGILSARIGYWLLPWEREVFGWNKTATTLSVLPAYYPDIRAVAFCLAAKF